MKRHLLVLVILLSILVVPFTGDQSASVEAQDQVTIRWWHIQTNPDQAAFWEKVANDYMAMHPNVTIDITVLENEAFKQRIVTNMQAGDPPDLFQSWGGGPLWQFADAGLLRDISDELEGEWRDSFSAQSAVEMFGQDGEYYGVPWSWGAVVMWYNKELFEQAGLDPENPPATWEEFLEVVQALKDAGITPIALGEGDKWPGHFWWVYLAIRCGGEEAFLAAYTREGSFDDEAFVCAGERLVELIELEPFQEGFLGLGYGDEAAAFGDGLAAMELMGHWAPGAHAENSESGGAAIEGKVGIFAFPTWDGAHDGLLGGGDGFVIGKNAPDETVDFLRYITSAEVQREAAKIWVIPVIAEAEDAIEDELLRQVLQIRNEATYAQMYYDQFLPPAVGQAVLDAVEGLFAEQYSPEEAAQIIEDEASFELD
ncbi:MAG: ABC transporter substrate-binding protein [Phototrophicales bacterium]|nr:MAG: ABC transporter substrate-binding protein [Phototrophicales bacterium]